MKNTTPDMYDRLQFLQQFKHVAVVGLSADQYRPSHFVAIYLQAEGYDIIPINPRYAGQTILGKRVYATLTEAKQVGETIEVVDVFRKPEEVLPIADEAIAIGAKVLWLQLGIRNEEAAQKARDAGLIVVQDRCMKIEHAGPAIIAQATSRTNRRDISVFFRISEPLVHFGPKCYAGTDEHKVDEMEEHQLLLPGKKHLPGVNIQRKEHLSCQQKRIRLSPDVLLKRPGTRGTWP